MCPITNSVLRKIEKKLKKIRLYDFDSKNFFIKVLFRLGESRAQTQYTQAVRRGPRTSLIKLFSRDTISLKKKRNNGKG